VLAFGERFDLGMRLVGDGGILFVEVEAESHRARVKLAEASGALLMVRDFVQLKLCIARLEYQEAHLESVRLQIQAVIGPVAKSLVALDERLVSDEFDVRADT
jgi:hypothetical protein